jgi:hypothetical protein
MKLLQVIGIGVIKTALTIDAPGHRQDIEDPRVRPCITKLWHHIGCATQLLGSRCTVTLQGWLFEQANSYLCCVDSGLKVLCEETLLVQYHVRTAILG